MAIPSADFTPQDTLVAIMIAVSVSDETIRTSELVTIERIVNHLPVFAAYDVERLKDVSATVLDMFEKEDGLDIFWNAARERLPDPLIETAYAMACDVVAADSKAREGS